MRRDAVALEVRRGVQEIDRVGHAVLDGELDRVHLVPQRIIQRRRIPDDPGAEVRGQVV